MRRTFLFQEGNSNKFWTIIIEGLSLTTIYGRIGSAGSATTKDFSSEQECNFEAERLIREKIRKGYKEEISDDSSRDEKLNLDEFWNLVERARKNSEGELETQASILSDTLSKRTVSDILEFGRIFELLHNQSYLSNLWAAAYIIMGGCSDDSFDYFRGWLISRGREVFQKAIEDPASLARYISVDQAAEIDGECMLGVAADAYVQKTGKDDYYDVLGTPSPRPDIEITWTEEREDLEKLFPALVKKYWSQG